MKWQRARRSSNVEDRRGGGGGGGGFGIGRMSFGGIAVVVVIGLLLGKNPLEMLGLIGQMQQNASAPQSSAPSTPANDEASQFVSAILGETEDVWDAIFRNSGSQYAKPNLVLFSGRVNSACGGATAAVGPFYCPGDHKVYIDLSFFEQMKRQLGGGGDFAYAYVIAHEVGHHVQTLTGVSAKVNALRARGDVTGADGPLVRQELQADCYAGVWAHHGQKRHDWLEEGDIDEALNTASAIGDDRLQKQATGTVVPDSFSHGSSAQRKRWFVRGFEGGNPAQCDTFAATTL